MELNPEAKSMIDKNRKLRCHFQMQFKVATSQVDDGKRKYRLRYHPKFDGNNREGFLPLQHIERTKIFTE